MAAVCVAWPAVGSAWPDPRLSGLQTRTHRRRPVGQERIDVSDLRMFPILVPRRPQASAWPTRIPWKMIQPHEQQALANHDQSLETLAARGGLGPSEMLAVLLDRPLQWVTRLTDQESADILWLIRRALVFDDGSA